MPERKKYSELTFTDDFLFCKIMTANPHLCKELLELILDIKIRKIEFADKQYSIEETYDGKGIRLDVYVEDSENTVYDLEMQTTYQNDLAKRTRYYQGMIDLNLIERGARYAQLKKSYIIFICLSNPFAQFGKNLPVYTFKNLCVQEPSLELGDDATKVIINASGDRTGLSDDMCAFLDFLQKKPAGSPLTQQLQGAVDKAVSRKEWEVQYMTMTMMLREERYEGLQEGIQQGIQEGIQQGEILQLIKTSRRLGLENDRIIQDLKDEFNFSEDEAVAQIRKYDESKE